MNIPVYIAHYQGNSDRLMYLKDNFSKKGLSPCYITEFDAGSFALETHYTFDEALFRSMVELIKDIMVGYVVGLNNPHLPWANAVAMVREQDLTVSQMEEACPWLRPKKLSAPEVSIFLKHRAAWQKIAQGGDEFAFVFEDDIIFSDESLGRIQNIVSNLPDDFEYIDVVGGCGMHPRVGNRVVNKYFYDIEPPRDRTVCGALIRKSFAKKLIDLDIPVCLPVDWHITYVVNRFDTKVYWIDPPIFGHGSEMNVYKSSIR